MRQLAVVVGLGIIVGLALQVQHVTELGQNSKNLEELCCLAFSKIGATLLESRLDAWATIKDSSSPAELKRLLIEVGEALDVELDTESLSISANNGLTLLGTSVTKGDTRYILTAQSSQGSTLVLVSVVRRGGEHGQFCKYQEGIKKVLPAKTAVQCTAFIPDDVGAAGRRRLMDQMFEVLQADTIETYTNINASSATGYTPLISGSLGYGNKRYNLQAAVRYDDVANMTYIYLGSPLLLSDY